MPPFHHPVLTREQLDADFGFSRAAMQRQHQELWRGEQPTPLWRPGGEIVSSPVHLWEVEQARDDVRRQGDMGRPVPVHLFLWSVKPPVLPFLTKLGGVPWRPRNRPWPVRGDGRPCTFVAQFCFADSREIVARHLPGDVLLVFFSEPDDGIHARSVLLEWSPAQIAEPMPWAAAPAPLWTVPRLSGVLYRSLDFPDGGEAADAVVDDQPYLVQTTQATSIGRSAFFIQNDPRQRGEELLACLSSIQPEFVDWQRERARWPFLDCERWPTAEKPKKEVHGWSDEQMILGDVGALYFLIDRHGRVRVDAQCY